MPVSRDLHVIARPTGLPDEDEFIVVEITVGDVAEGEVLEQNPYMSVHPVMRFQRNGVAPLNETPRGAGLHEPARPQPRLRHDLRPKWRGHGGSHVVHDRAADSHAEGFSLWTSRTFAQSWNAT